MTDACFELTISNRIAHIQLNRPERKNMMTLSFWDELPDLVKKIERESTARVIVLSSTGRHFSAGLDLSVFQSLQSQGAQGPELYSKIKLMQRCMSSLADCRIPVIAAIQGAAIGGAVDLLSACDLRYCSEEAYFTIEEINVGMTADVGTFPRLLKLMPEAVVKEYAFTGAQLTAQHAESLGFVNAVLPSHEAAVNHAMDVARTIASKAPMAMWGTKRAIHWSRDHTTQDGLDQIALWNASALSWSDINESIKARAEGREGHYDDLPPVVDNFAD